MVVEVSVELGSMGLVEFRTSRGQPIALNHIHDAIKPEQQAGGLGS